MAIKITDIQLKEIAERMDCGEVCFIHRSNGNILFIPDEDKHYGMEMDAWENELEEVEKNCDKYFSVEPLDSNDSFRIMEDFINTVDAEVLRKELIHAIEKRKPFMHFKYVIDRSGQYRQQWFDYKDQRMKEWVQHCIDAENYTAD